MLRFLVAGMSIVVLALAGAVGFLAYDRFIEDEGQPARTAEEEYVRRFCQLTQANLTSIEREIAHMEKETLRDWSDLIEDADYVRGQIIDFRETILGLVPPPGAVDFHSTFVEDLAELESLLREYGDIAEWAERTARPGAESCPLSSERLAQLGYSSCAEWHEELARRLGVIRAEPETWVRALQDKAKEMTRVFGDIPTHLPSADIWDLIAEDPYCAEGLEFGR